MRWRKEKKKSIQSSAEVGAEIEKGNTPEVPKTFKKP